MKNKAVFLDRDGTINIEKGYLHKIEDFVLLPGAAEAVSEMNRLGYKVIVITNQSGIARGFYTEDDMQTLHSHMKDVLASKNAAVDAIYFCPHHPEAQVSRYRKDCGCRKPKAGLFIKAAEDFDIDFERSWAVGDRIRDILPAKQLGMKSALVLTGHKKAEEICQAPAVFDDLSAFVKSL